MSHNSPATTTFTDVKKGSIPSAENQNKLHAAVRELQQGRRIPDAVTVELHRLDATDLSTSRPSADDGEIGTVNADTGLSTQHTLETTNYTSYKVSEISDEIKREFVNAGQKIFSRDEVFALASLYGRDIPIKLGGADFILARTFTTIPAATAWDTPGFGNVNVVDWVADGTGLEETGQVIRVANVAYIAGSEIASGNLIGAVQYGKVYIVIFVLCGT